LNCQGRDPSEISLAQQEEIVETLAELFGTPDEPRIPQEAAAELRLDRVRMAAGPMRTDRRGNESGLYRRHCAACHGVSGDGAGPTAAAQYLFPRDFRQGIYKYTSTADGAKPVAGDLDRVLRNGLPDTVMPRFDRLADEQVAALVEYVKYLSIRGETELFLLQLVVDADIYPVETAEVVEDGLLPVVGLWASAGETHIRERESARSAPPVKTLPQRKASIRRGQKFFRSKNTQCVQCHGRDGAGDGEQTELDDHWNKSKRRATPSQTWAVADRFRLPLQSLRPRDFTRGIFHGGERPVDVYWRIHVGIKGTPMPAVGSAGALEPDQIWDVVHYVRSRGE
jgi:mono/diheme cytochrome c family protein